VSRLNPESEWVIHEVHELRIINQEVSETVKPRQQKPSLGENTLDERRQRTGGTAAVDHRLNSRFFVAVPVYKAGA
jgi:hypothetical protein